MPESSAFDLFQFPQEAFQFRRKWREELHPLACARMAKSQSLRVQELAPKSGDERTRAQIRDGPIAPLSVFGVSNDRMLQPCEMDADLMRAASLYHDIEQGEFFEPLPHAKDRERRTSIARHGHARAMNRMTPDRLIDAP